MAQDPRQRQAPPEKEPEELLQESPEHPDVEPGRGTFEPDAWRPSDAESSPTRLGKVPGPSPSAERRSAPGESES